MIVSIKRIFNVGVIWLVCFSHSASANLITKAPSNLKPPRLISDVLTKGFTLNAGDLTITGASSTIKHIEFLFSDRADCSPNTTPTTAYTMVTPIIDSTGLTFTAGQTINFNANAIYQLITSISTTGTAPSGNQCMQVYLTDDSTNGVSCVSYADLTCSDITQTCSSSSTNTAAWVANPTACVPFLFSSNNTMLYQGLTNREFMRGTPTSGGIAFQSLTVWLLSNTSGGMVKSKNSGVTWANVPTGVTTSLRGLSCTGHTCVAVGASGVILFSTINGANWATATGSGTVASTNQLNAVSCSGTTCVAVGNAVSSVGTIIYSSNSGQSWTRSNAGVGNAVPTASLNNVNCSSSTNCVAVGASSNIVYSSNSGATWTAAGGTILSNPYNSVSCVGLNCVAVGTNTVNLSISNDAGHTWSTVTTGVTGLLNGVSCTASYCVAVGGSTNRVIRSTDDGATWSAISSTALTSVTPSNVLCTGNTCIIGTSSGASIGYSSDGGTTWTLTSNDFGTTSSSLTNIYCTGTTCLAVVPPSSGAPGTFQSTDRGATWAGVSGTTGSNFQSQHNLTCSGTTCLTVGTSGIINKSIDSGSTWTTQTSHTSTDLKGVSCDGTVCLAVGNVASGESQGFIDVSSDTGSTWTAVTTTNAGNHNLSAVNCNSGACVAVGQAGTIVYSTDPAHTTWTSADSSTAQNLLSVACLSGSTCIACGNSGTIEQSTDSGISWTILGTPANPVAPTATQLNAIACTGSTCFIAGGSSPTNLLISTDSGSDWRLLLPKIASILTPSVSVF